MKTKKLKTKKLTLREFDETHILLVKDKRCGHQFNVCLVAADCGHANDLPCPVCHPRYNYLIHGIFRIGELNLGGPGPEHALPCLVCPSCHEYLCPRPRFSETELRWLPKGCISDADLAEHEALTQEAFQNQ